MRIFLFKFILSFAAFGLISGLILPWLISNNEIPLWADIGLVSMLLFIVITMIHQLGNELIFRLKRVKEYQEFKG